MTSPGDVYWLEQTEAQVPPGEDWLSAAEAIALRALRFAKRRTDWRLGRWTAKNAVAGCLGVPFELRALRSIEIRASTSGAPEAFLEDQPARVAISLSHRSGLGACIVGQTSSAIGCDLELIEPHGDAFVGDFFSREERALIASASKGVQDALVALLWSTKESALKALREGLRLDTRSVLVTPGIAPLSESEDWHPLQACFVNGQTFHGWWNQSRGFIRTILADPPPAPPILLKQRRAFKHG